MAGRAARLVMVASFLAGLASWYYAVYIRPPAPTPCGSEGGPPVTATRIRLRDGRFLAYSETGVARGTAAYKIVLAHGFGGSRLDAPRVSPVVTIESSILVIQVHESLYQRIPGGVYLIDHTTSLQGLLEELRIYMVGYDRAGFGESDPNPNRSLRSEASDITELADALELGPRFYLVGFSLGGHAVWASIKYIPGRLAGAALMAPVINYRWPGFPSNLSNEVYKKQQLGDQWALRVAYYAPWLLHWWMNQPWLPQSTVIKGTTHLPNRLDEQIHQYAIANKLFEERRKLATQQGVQESFYRDMAVMFGKWEFDPMELSQPPFPVHIWQGDEDGLVPVTLQRYISSHLSWIEYHELEATGHYLAAVEGLGDVMLKALLVESFARNPISPKSPFVAVAPSSPLRCSLLLVRLQSFQNMFNLLCFCNKNPISPRPPFVVVAPSSPLRCSLLLVRLQSFQILIVLSPSAHILTRP
ncbi:hypothetical protein ZIOFF_056608 [Zingiber officinale]|uniref:AB hydrolase-1 domain-containing protein n=1 Tax=Zingiber officinale TaxID=94328 RepID=A0A8J5FJ51_ZINOF|nr:hypothetical protein ZIOFF_056608 [Zingiber officinale]